VIKMEMADEDQVDHFREIEGTGSAAVEELEIRESRLLGHVDSAVKHDCAATNLSNDARSAYILASTKRYNFNSHTIIKRSVIFDS